MHHAHRKKRASTSWSSDRELEAAPQPGTTLKRSKRTLVNQDAHESGAVRNISQKKKRKEKAVPVAIKFDQGRETLIKRGREKEN